MNYCRRTNAVRLYVLAQVKVLVETKNVGGASINFSLHVKCYVAKLLSVHFSSSDFSRTSYIAMHKRENILVYLLLRVTSIKRKVKIV